MDQWFNEHWQTCLTAVGEIDKQVIPVDDAWFVDYEYSWNTGTEHNIFYLVNKLKGVKQIITREQAQTPEDIRAGYRSITIDEEQAKELAISLGLAS